MQNKRICFSWRLDIILDFICLESVKNELLKCMKYTDPKKEKQKGEGIDIRYLSLKNDTWIFCGTKYLNKISWNNFENYFKYKKYRSETLANS